MLRRRAAFALAAVTLLGACGGQQAGAPAAGTTADTRTPEQKAAAAALLSKYTETPQCGCTGALRAKDRAVAQFKYGGENLVAVVR